MCLIVLLPSPPGLEHCLPTIPLHLGDKALVHLNAENVPVLSWNAKSEAAENVEEVQMQLRLGLHPQGDAENAS